MMVGLWPVRERFFTLRESEALGLACMVASSALFALMGLCVKLAGQALPVQEITLVRAAGGLLVTTAMILSLIHI